MRTNYFLRTKKRFGKKKIVLSHFRDPYLTKGLAHRRHSNEYNV